MRNWGKLLRLGAAMVAVGCYGDPGSVTLSDENSGTREDLALHQEVDVTLHTIGPGQYGEPSISSPAVQFLGMQLVQPQTPAGPTQKFSFKAVADGTTQISIPHDGGRAPFTITFGCCAR